VEHSVGDADVAATERHRAAGGFPFGMIASTLGGKLTGNRLRACCLAHRARGRAAQGRTHTVQLRHHGGGQGWRVHAATHGCRRIDSVPGIAAMIC